MDRKPIKVLKQRRELPPKAQVIEGYIFDTSSSFTTALKAGQVTAGFKRDKLKLTIWYPKQVLAKVCVIYGAGITAICRKGITPTIYLGTVFYDTETERQTRLHLLQAGETITHHGDYGELFWQAVTKSVVWVRGEADRTSSTTPVSEIKRKFLAVDPEINVDIYYEESPTLEEGYFFLGKTGRTRPIQDAIDI